MRQLQAVRQKFRCTAALHYEQQALACPFCTLSVRSQPNARAVEGLASSVCTLEGRLEYGGCAVWMARQ